MSNIASLRPGTLISVYTNIDGKIVSWQTNYTVNAVILSKSKDYVVLQVLHNFLPNKDINRIDLIKNHGILSNKENTIFNVLNEKVSIQDQQLEIVTSGINIHSINGFSSNVENNYRNMQASIIVESLPNKECYAFGGYTRDMVAGTKFNDIDIYINDIHAEKAFFNSLKDKGFTIVFNRDAKYVKKASSKKYFITKGDFQLSMDVVNAYGHTDVNPVTDADINMIAMRSDGTRFSLSNSTTVKNIEENIRNKVYVQYTDMTLFRQNKLKQYGFFIKPSSAVEHFVSNKYPQVDSVVPIMSISASDYNSLPLSDSNSNQPNQYKNTKKSSFKYKDEYDVILDELANAKDDAFNEANKELMAQEDALLFKALDNVQIKSLKSILKDDAKSAMYRAASNQITKRIKNLIINLLEKEKIDSETITLFSKMLDTEMGSSFISMMIGLSMTYAPKIKDNDTVKILAQEFRTQSIAIASSEVFNLLMNNFSELLISNIQSLPIEAKFRINDPESIIDNELQNQKINTVIKA